VNQRIFAASAALAAAAVLLAAACGAAIGADSGTAGANALAAPISTAEADYHITVDDVLRMDVWGEPQLSNMQMQVTPGGTINVPFLGEMQASGLTQAELARQIAKKLADSQILYEAKVQITVISLHRPQVRVLGAVQRPGSFEFKEGDCVLDALAQGGSYTEDAMLEAGTITHRGSHESIPINIKKLVEGDLSQNYPLKNGDAIYIPHEEYSNKIYVLGQVNRPGQYPLKDKTTILAAISLAGGQNDRGSVFGTIVLRGDPARPEKVNCNLKNLFEKGDLSQNLELKSGDIVVVPDSKKLDWGKIAQVVNMATNLSYLHRWGWW
jgi:polysaccharide export outer membrane protein